MKTRTNLISKKSLIKASSSIMSLVLTANIGLSLLDKNVFAGEVSITDGVVTLTSSFGDTNSEFHLASGGISYSRNNQDFNEPVSDNASFTIKNSTLYVDSDYIFNSITLNNSTLYINGCSVEWVSISGSGTAKITNCGTLDTDGFSASTLANNGIRYFQNGEGTTPGTITGRSVSINNDIYSDVSGSVIEAQNAFRKDTRDINATVDVGSLTTIESEGGTFTLSVYGATKVISGEVADGTDAYTLFDSPEVALSGIPSVIYYGQEYNISDYVSVAEGYDESLITYEYSSNGGLNVLEGKPSYPGNYSVRAKAPSYGSFLEENTGWTSYNIKFLPTDALEEFYNEGDPYVTVTGVTTGSDNKKYVGEGITLTAPEGVLLQFPSAEREALHTPAQSVTLTHDDLFLEGYTTINQDFDIQFVRERDGATTEYKSILEVVDGIEDYIFDNNDPVIKGYSVEDSTFTSISLESDKVVANVLQISISDDNLSEVTIYINGSSTDYSDKIKDDGTFSLNIGSEAGKSLPIRVIAKDISGRETVVEFELFHEPVDPTFNVSWPSEFYIGDDFSSQISVDTNSDGEIRITYNNSMIQPTEVGYYELRIHVSATDFYNSYDYSRMIKIVNKLTGVTVTVDDINVGGTVTPVLSGVPDDFDGSVYYSYKAVDDDVRKYDSSVPTEAGTYNVKATFISASTYGQAEIENTFTISRNEFSPSVSIANITVGGTVSPSLSGVPEDYEGTDDIEYWYMPEGEDVEFTEDVPTEAGTYVVMVVFPETDTYAGTECTATFTISKNIVEGTVEVADIYVGGTITPVITTASDGKNRATFEYKLSTAADTEYSTTLPTGAGTYMVRATIPETDKYGKIVCYDDFTISKIPVTAAISVSDTLVGTTPVTELSMDQAEYDGEYSVEYKAISAPDTAYSTMVPTSAGSYIARFKLPDTDTYIGTTVTDYFTISKNTIDGINVSVDNIFVGGTISPVMSGVPADYDGTITYAYKLSGAETYSVSVPKDAGTYNVQATLSSTDKYLGTTCNSSFTISKNNIDGISVSVDSIFVGGTISPVMSGIPAYYDGTIAYTYKLTTDEDYSDAVPTAAGTYNVKATLPTTDKYIGTSCTNTFTISKNSASATITVADITVGNNPEPVVTTNSDGKADTVIEYKLTTVPESAFSTTVPTASGTYDVRATVPETFAYTGATAYATFTISKNSATAEVSVANITVGNKPEPVVTTVSDGKADATFEYKAADADDTEYSDTIPTAAGTYSVRATVPATAEYLGITCTSEFTISLNKVTVMDLTVEDIYYGQTVTPSFKTDSDGSVTIMYKLTVAPDSAYSTTVPTVTGKYTARATVSETDTYEGAVCYKEFSISYLEAPQVAYNPTGKSGNEGYFTSDVQLAAPEGYTISATTDGEYSKSIPYTEGMDKIYLKRDDGALTSAITITNKPMIDKSAPAITTSTGSIADGSVMYASDMSITISDTNLKSLKVNGEVIDIKAGTSNVITLSPGYGIKKFVIIAEDIAGNVTTIEFTLKAEWLENKIILPDVSLPLFSEESYTLDDGQWIVTKKTTSGTVKDTTVYNGDLPVYVNEDGDYTFTKVT